MSDLALSPDQVRAFDAARSWFVGASNSRPVFRLFGLAGTGKTTVLDLLTQSLGLRASDVVYTATTGKAAKVLTGKGCAATTVHKAFYRCVSSNDEYFDALGAERSSLSVRLKLNADNAGASRWKARIAEIDNELRKQKPNGLKLMRLLKSKVST